MLQSLHLGVRKGKGEFHCGRDSVKTEAEWVNVEIFVGAESHQWAPSVEEAHIF